MRPLKTFEEYIKRGTVRKRKKDISRASSLAEEAKNKKKFIDEAYKKIGIKDYNANSIIENSYDVIMCLLRSKMLLEGYHSSGEGAHEAEVAFMQKLRFTENDIRFMNQLRYFRNGILYYGKKFDAEYAEKIIDFLNKAFDKLEKK